MYNNLKGKKLLILGGIRLLIDVVKRAQKMGVYVIVVDNTENSPAKKIADKSVFADALDEDKIIELCISEGVHGITTGYVDILMPVCNSVCKKLGLEYYATEEMISASTDKEFFKRMCNNHNVSVPKTYELDIENDITSLAKLPYPVFVKPLDASGSRGVKTCNNNDELVQAYKNAMKWSTKKQVIIEENLTGTEIIIDYLLVDGVPYLMSMQDRLKSDQRADAMNHADLIIGPSRYLKNYIETTHQGVVDMFKNMNFKNGIIFLQGYVSNGHITFFEMGCRLGGSYPPIVEKFEGFNPIDALVHYSLTGRLFNNTNDVKIEPFFIGNGAIFNFVLSKTEGYISRIDGLNDIKEMPQVLHTIQHLYEGDKFSIGKGTDVLAVTVFMGTEDKSDFVKKIEEIYSKLKVVDSNGESLLVNPVRLDNFKEIYGGNA